MKKATTLSNPPANVGPRRWSAALDILSRNVSEPALTATATVGSFIREDARAALRGVKFDEKPLISDALFFFLSAVKTK